MMSDLATVQPLGHLRLHFQNQDTSKIPGSLSAVEQIDNSLWLVGDESTSVERLTSFDYANYDAHASFDLGEFFDLPGGADQEIDLEGLAWDEGPRRLWLVGSHSWRRKQPKPGVTDKDVFKALSKVDRQANRYLLGYLELDDPGRAADGSTLARAPTKGIAVPFSDHDSQLIEELRSSKTFAPFLEIPSKDNGFDIEGVAVRNGCVFLGLRGPVLRGWATILQLTFDHGDKGALTLRAVTDGKRGYLQHVLDLGGLGIRVCVCDDDLFVLAGPTMALDGPMRVFRWRDAFKHDKDSCIDDSRLELLLDLPYGKRVDHAEGLALFKRPNGTPQLLVVYDSPAKGRLHEGKYFEADLFHLV